MHHISWQKEALLTWGMAVDMGMGWAAVGDKTEKWATAACGLAVTYTAISGEAIGHRRTIAELLMWLWALRKKVLHRRGPGHLAMVL